jgi:MFS family permease
MSSKLFYGWRVVAACFVIASFAWGLGLFGSSVYLQAVTAARGWSVSQVSAAITVFLVTSAVVQRPLGRSIGLHGPRPALLAGAISMVVSVVSIGLIDSSWQLYPCFALLGVGWATLSTTGISATVAPWFERHQGRSITLAITGASLGAIVFVPLLIFVVGRWGLRDGLFAIGATAAIVLLPLVSIVLRYRSPAELNLERDGDVPQKDKVVGTTGSRIATPSNRRRLIWSSTAAFSLVLLVQIGFIAHHVKLAEPFLGTVGAGLLVSATGVVTFVGRLYLATVVDASPVRRLALQAMITQLVAMLAIAIHPSAPVLVLASLAYGFAIGHVTSLSPIVVRREFGAEEFGAVYGGAATMIQLSSALGPAFVGYLRDVFGGYPGAFLVCAIVSAAGCAILHLGEEPSGSIRSSDV